LCTTPKCVEEGDHQRSESASRREVQDAYHVAMNCRYTDEMRLAVVRAAVAEVSEGEELDRSTHCRRTKLSDRTEEGHVSG